MSRAGSAVIVRLRGAVRDQETIKMIAARLSPII